MLNFLGSILGKLLKIIYDLISRIGEEPSFLSYYALSVILATILLEFLVLPLGRKQKESMKLQQKLNPEIQKLQEKYKNDKQTLNIKTMELYKEHNFNPASGCLGLFIQLPIALAFFRVMRDPVKFVFHDVAFYEAINKSFFWIKDLTMADSLIYGLPLLAGLTTYLQSSLMTKANAGAMGDAKMESTQRTMSIMMPVLIFISARSLPAGVILYWITRNIFSIIQQFIMMRSVELK